MFEFRNEKSKIHDAYLTRYNFAIFYPRRLKLVSKDAEEPCRDDKRIS